MQSHTSSKKRKQKQDKPRLPWGLGSARFKGSSWWLVYRTADDKVREENSGTADLAEAQRLLAAKALPRVRAAVALLERMANGETEQTKKRTGSKRPKSGPVPAVGSAPAAPARKTGSKGGRA